MSIRQTLKTILITIVIVAGLGAWVFFSMKNPSSSQAIAETDKLAIASPTPSASPSPSPTPNATSDTPDEPESPQAVQKRSPAAEIDPENRASSDKPTELDPNALPRIDQPTQVAVDPPVVTDPMQKPAVGIIQNWLTAKKEILGAPYNLDQLNKLTTGEVLFETQGAAAWRKANNDPWTSAEEKVGEVINFTKTDQTVWLQVLVEGRPYQYRLEEDQGTFKISEIKPINIDPNAVNGNF